MPALTWTIDAADRPILDSLTTIERAADRAAAVVKGIGGAGGIGGIGAAARTHGPAFHSFFQDALSSATGFIGAGVFERLIQGMTAVGGRALTLAGNLESDTSALASFAGSTAAAQRQLAAFNQFAALTSFRQDAVVKYAVQLEGVGIAGARVVPTLRSIADALAGVGRGADQQKLQQVADAYLKIQTQGRAQADELLSFAEAGIPIYDLLAQSLGTSTAEITKLAEAGRLTAQVFDQAFDVGVQARWQGAAARSSQTLQGILSNAQDVGDQFLTLLGTAAVAGSGLEARLQGVVTYLNDPGARAAVEHLGAELGAAAGYAFDLVGALGQVLGLPPLTIPAPPVRDFASTAASASQIANNLALSTTAATDYSREIAHAKAEIDRIADATRDQDRIYDSQLDKLRDQGTQLERNRQIARADRDIARLRTDINKDAQRAIDPYSAQGQAAAKRLKDERARLADLLADQQDDAARAANQADVTRVERSKRSYDQQQQDAQRAAQATIDAYKRLQEALTHPDQAIADATTYYKQFYGQTIPDLASSGTADAISQMTQQYAQFYSHPAGSGVTFASLFTNLFGTAADQAAQGAGLGLNFMGGLGQTLFAGGAGGGLAEAIGAKFWAQLTGDKAGAQRADTALTQAYAQIGHNAGAALGSTAQQAWDNAVAHFADVFNPPVRPQQGPPAPPTIYDVPPGTPGFLGPIRDLAAAQAAQSVPSPYVAGGHYNPSNYTYVPPVQQPQSVAVEVTTIVRSVKGEVIEIVDQHVTGKLLARRLGEYASR